MKMTWLRAAPQACLPRLPSTALLVLLARDAPDKSTVGASVEDLDMAGVKDRTRALTMSI